ncbi:MAG: acyl-CoA dehydrogenase family protein [Bacteroidetes bacterium]|nr:acyl-CoA dehydrogenase family protein [Bacteroidota bacterium]
MSSKFYSKENLNFLLHDVFPIDELCKKEIFKDHTPESLDMILDAAGTMSETQLRPILVEMDNKPPYIENGRVKVHPKMRDLMQTFGKDGWISMSAPHEFGGQQVPFTVVQAVGFVMGAANYSTMVYPYLTTGAAHLIESFATQELKEKFIPKMYSGDWQGTMAMTEPGAGSSLSDLTSTATPTADGHYLIKGQKVFISCGDSDAVDNVVHLMLARIEGAPLGTKGISLFIVPRLRPKANGELVFNDVNTAGVFHKMGYHGAPIAHLIMGENSDCHGYLVGEANKGLSYMFQMMNEARIGVGCNAVSIASAAYYNSLDYANIRLQGRKVTEKDPAKPQIPIIEHADVKRLLLFQKAIVEGSLSLVMEATTRYDRWQASEGEEKERNLLVLELLTPMVKSYPAEMSIQTTSAALQCFGGYGYTKEFMAELFFRETRIHTLHEGATAIHGMDLLGRKVMMKNGMATMLLMQEVMEDIEKAQKYDSIKAYAIGLGEKLMKLQEVTVHLVSVAQSEGPEAYLSDATLYLELFGILAIGWQWIKQGTKVEELKQAQSKNYSAEFLQSKMYALQYFFEYEVPKVDGLITRLMSKNRVTVNAKKEEIL